MTSSQGKEIFLVRAEAVPARLHLLRTVDGEALRSSSSSEDETPEGVDDSLGKAAEKERDYVRRRLHDELGRKPSEEEVDEWLRRHTEGY